MALVAGFPSGDGVTTHASARRDLEGAVVRNAAGKMRAGVFYAHSGDLFTRRPDMRLDIPEFRAVQDKQGACFIAGVGTTTTPAFDAAPAANRRIDLLYLTQELAALDGTTETIFGIVKGTASPTPTAPDLPAHLSDAIRWATVEIPAGATSMQSVGVIITPVYPYTAMAGGTVVVRAAVELAAWAPADGARAYCVSDGREYLRQGGKWRLPVGVQLAYAEAATAAPINALDMPVATPTLLAGQRVRVETSLIGGSSGTTNPASYYLLYTTNGSAVTTSSTPLVMGRFLPPSAGNVASAPPLATEFEMPVDGPLRVALNPAFAIYSDKRWMSIRTA